MSENGGEIAIGSALFINVEGDNGQFMEGENWVLKILSAGKSRGLDLKFYGNGSFGLIPETRSGAKIKFQIRKSKF